MTDQPIFKIPAVENSISQGLREFFKKMIETDAIDALFLPVQKREKGSVLPALITDPDKVASVVPFSPAFPLNSGRMASRISYRESGRKTAVFMRPCEHRAFIELVKLKQGARDELVLVGTDCCGALTWKDFEQYTADRPLKEDEFIQKIFTSRLSPFESDLNGLPFSPACRTCENCFPANTDLNLILYGADLSEGLRVQACTGTGKKILEAMDLDTADLPKDRDAVTAGIQEAGSRANREMIADIEEKTNTIPKLDAFFDRCINCYNCRNMCPVCYCRECVFNTDVFSHQPVQYYQWANKNGAVKLPTDTLFYHLTRMVHMGHACVGCGQCSNACPSDIPVFELFKSVGALTQDAFDYRPGIDEAQAPPLSIFKEKEFESIVGI